MRIGFPNPRTDSGLFLCSIRASESKRAIYNCSILDSQRTILKTIDQIQVLRLWNSSTPLYSELRRGFGGFYYLIWNHKGIIVDPGLNFVDIFSRQFRTINDIDHVIVTHDHPDHCEGLSNIVTLLHEFNENKRRPHVIRFAVSRGTYSKYASLFRKRKLKRYVKKLVPSRTFRLSPDIAVSTIKNKHREISSRSNGVGLKFFLKYGTSSTYSFGITSDTGYFTGLSNFYDRVSMLILHIGTLEDFGSGKLLGNHLGFRGIVLMLTKMVKPPNLALVSEWGQELFHTRKDIGEHLQKYIPNTKILPADFLFRLSIPDHKVYIEQDDRFALASNVFVSNDYGSKLRYKAI